jgi:peptide/nickel transport system substrate-binding protein
MGTVDRSDPGFEQFEQFLDAWSRRDFLRRMGGAAALAAFAAGGAEFLAACGTGATTPTQNAKTGGHVVEGTTSDPSTFTPGFITDTASAIPSGMMYVGLLDSKADGTLIPAIAKAVPKVESDQLTYKFDLRQDVFWSDGKQVTADDVLFNVNMSHGTAYNYKAINTRIWPDLDQYLDSVTAPDKFTVIVKTKVPYGPFLTNYTPTPLPRHIMEPAALNNPADFKKQDFNLKPPVVNGPFQFDSLQKGSQMSLKANPKHYLGRPKLDSYVIKVVADSTAIVNQLKTGELDIGSIQPSLWDDMATANNVNRISFVGAGWTYFAYNMDPTNPKRPIASHMFGDAATGKMVRQALYFAVDRQKIVDAVYFKQGSVAMSVEPKISWALTNNVPKYPFDAAKAESLLDQAGWAKGSDGMRAKGGQKMSFELILQSGSKPLEATSQILQEAWRKIGVDATPKQITFPEFIQLDVTRDFDVMLGGIVSGTDPDLTQVYHSRTIGHGLNSMGYRSTELDNLLDQAVASVDQNKRKQMYVRVQQLLMEDVPSPQLVWPNSLYGISKRVNNFGIGAFNRYGSRPWLKDVWVSDGK